MHFVVKDGEGWIRPSEKKTNKHFVFGGTAHQPQIYSFLCCVNELNALFVLNGHLPKCYLISIPDLK